METPLCICGEQDNHHHECPRSDLEPIASIAERTFSAEVREIRQHIDSDRLRGKTDWDRECQESRRLNRS